jgi:hypothetical protein
VAVLALWRWVATLGALIPIAVTTATALLGAAGVTGLARRPGPERLGADFASLWAGIPGHEIIAGPLDGISKVTSWPGALPLIGEWLMGVAIIGSAFLILARIGVGRWEAWDHLERQAARKRVPEHSRPWWQVPAGILLAVASVAMSAGTFAVLWR